jgi:hypothetical protein
MVRRLAANDRSSAGFPSRSSSPRRDAGSSVRADDDELRSNFLDLPDVKLVLSGY